MATDPENKLNFELLLEEQKGLNSMENWATTLFLTAIALITKQFIEWANPTSPSNATAIVPMPEMVFLVPSIVGLTGFIFLRLLNFRIRRVRQDQYQLLPGVQQWSGSNGLVGWSMAGMPLFAGFACSWYFASTRPSLCISLYVLMAVALISVAVAIQKFRTQTAHAQKSKQPKLA